VNIAQLRETIVSLLSASPNLIGSYVLPNGTKIPAVYVVGRNGVPTEWKVEGLEVAIREFPELLPSAGVGIVDVLQQWEVVLNLYTTNSKNLAEAMNRMVRRFPDARYQYLPGNDVAYESCRIIIADREIRRLFAAG
jgi:hypothetical protein